MEMLLILLKLIFNLILIRYKRDYYINDLRLSSSSTASSVAAKSPTTPTATMKSTNFDDNDDDVSEMNLCEVTCHQTLPENDKSYLFEKFLNSSATTNFDTMSKTSQSSRNSDDSLIPTKILKQLESQMLHSDLRRESFRARSGTSNFCLNPLFEEGFGNENIANHSREISLSSRNSECSADEIRVNCVEEILVGLCKIRRSASPNSSNSEKPSFVVERCNSLKRSERRLK